MEDKLQNVFNKDVCPKCGSVNITPVRYTWWGGIIGPRIMNHTKCQDCRYVYNKKSGESNNKNIVLYFVVIFVLTFAVFYLLRNNY